MLQHTATRCNSQRVYTCSPTRKTTTTHCYTLRHTVTHCNTLQHTATRCNTLVHCCDTLQHTATCPVDHPDRAFWRNHRSDCLSKCLLRGQNNATHCKILQHTATQSKDGEFWKDRVECLLRCLFEGTTHYNTLQHTATHCNDRAL